MFASCYHVCLLKLISLKAAGRHYDSFVAIKKYMIVVSGSAGEISLFCYSGFRTFIY